MNKDVLDSFGNKKGYTFSLFLETLFKNFEVAVADELYVEVYRDTPDGGLKLYSGYPKGLDLFPYNEDNIVRVFLNQGIMYLTKDELYDFDIADKKHHYVFVVKVK